MQFDLISGEVSVIIPFVNDYHKLMILNNMIRNFNDKVDKAVKAKIWTIANKIFETSDQYV